MVRVLEVRFVAFICSSYDFKKSSRLNEKHVLVAGTARYLVRTGNVEVGRITGPKKWKKN